MILDQRKRAGITQAELASKLGVERSTIAKWETKQANPRVGRLAEIAQALGCEIVDLLDIQVGQDQDTA